MSSDEDFARGEVERQVGNLFDTLEWVFQQASADDREYLLSRGFRSVFRNDGAFRVGERRRLSATAFNTMLPFLSVLNGGVGRVHDLLASFGSKRLSFEELIATVVAGMKRTGVPANEKVSDLAPFVPSLLTFLRPPFPGEPVASPSPAPSRPTGTRDLEKTMYETIVPWIRENRGELSEEAWIRLFLAAATNVDEEGKPQRFIEKVIAKAKKRM